MIFCNGPMLSPYHEYTVDVIDDDAADVGDIDKDDQHEDDSD